MWWKVDTEEDQWEKEMDQAVAKRNYAEAERLSKNLYNLQVAQAVRDATAKADYELFKMVGVSKSLDPQRDENKPRPMLDWKYAFAAK